MTWYLRAYVIDGQVAHVHCDTEIIERDIVNISVDCLRVSAEVEGEYQHAGAIFPVLTWDGEKLGGVPVVNQAVSSSTP